MSSANGHDFSQYHQSGTCWGETAFSIPYGAHADDACNWDANNKHTTDIVFENAQSAVLKRTLDSTVYYVSLRWEGKASLKEKSANYFVLTPTEDKLAFSCKFTSAFPGTVFESEPAVYTSADTLPTFAETLAAGNSYWNNFWKNGAAVDFSHCTDRVPKNWNAVSY